MARDVGYGTLVGLHSGFFFRSRGLDADVLYSGGLQRLLLPALQVGLSIALSRIGAFNAKHQC